jgi:sporulation protein YlmC with PRC-barrel domain
MKDVDGTFQYATDFSSHTKGEASMKMTMLVAILITGASGAAMAATTLSGPVPESWTVTDYYKQAVYDTNQSKIGDIDDVLVDNSGKVTALVVGVGGFLGAGEKDVAVPFTSVKRTKKDDKWWLTLNETKDGLTKATGYKYDKATTTWVVDKK